MEILKTKYRPELTLSELEEIVCDLLEMNIPMTEELPLSHRKPPLNHFYILEGPAALIKQIKEFPDFIPLRLYSKKPKLDWEEGFCGSLMIFKQMKRIKGNHCYIGSYIDDDSFKGIALIIRNEPWKSKQ